MFKTNLMVVGHKNYTGKKRMIDYYLIWPDGEQIYLFCKNYSNKAYNLCKGGIRANDLLLKKSKDVNVMNLVNHMKRFESYLKYEYDVA